MNNPPDSDPNVKPVELIIRPSQVAIAGLTLLAVFGAAGALVVILVWVNLASLILLFGAEFICVYSIRFGSRAQPKEYAEALTAEAKATQGMPVKELLYENSEHKLVR